jgi:hypothetical protein
MNKIVRRSYPVEKLPEDLQSGLPKDGKVDVELYPTVVEGGWSAVAELVGTGRNVHGDAGTVVGHIQSIREDR